LSTRSQFLVIVFCFWFFRWKREKGHKATKAERSTKEIPNDEQGISNDKVKEKNHGDKRHKDSRGKGIE